MFQSWFMINDKFDGPWWIWSYKPHVTFGVYFKKKPSNTAICLDLRTGHPKLIGSKMMNPQQYIGNSNGNKLRGNWPVHSWQMTGSWTSPLTAVQPRKWAWACSPSVRPAGDQAVHGVPAMWNMATASFKSHSRLWRRQWAFLSWRMVMMLMDDWSVKTVVILGNYTGIQYSIIYIWIVDLCVCNVQLKTNWITIQLVNHKSIQ